MSKRVRRVGMMRKAGKHYVARLMELIHWIGGRTPCPACGAVLNDEHSMTHDHAEFPPRIVHHNHYTCPRCSLVMSLSRRGR